MVLLQNTYAGNLTILLCLGKLKASRALQPGPVRGQGRGGREWEAGVEGQSIASRLLSGWGLGVALMALGGSGAHQLPLQQRLDAREEKPRGSARKLAQYNQW